MDNGYIIERRENYIVIITPSGELEISADQATSMSHILSGLAQDIYETEMEDTITTDSKDVWTNFSKE